MEVVKYGKGVRLRLGTCRNCGTIYRYTKNDIEVNYGKAEKTHYEEPGTTTDGIVRCPACNSTTVLKIND